VKERLLGAPPTSHEMLSGRESDNFEDSKSEGKRSVPALLREAIARVRRKSGVDKCHSSRRIRKLSQKPLSH